MTKSSPKQISDAIEKEFGKKISVMVRSVDEIERSLKITRSTVSSKTTRTCTSSFLRTSYRRTRRSAADMSVENEQFAVKRPRRSFCLKISIVDSAVGKGFIDKKLKGSGHRLAIGGPLERSPRCERITFICDFENAVAGDVTQFSNFTTKRSSSKNRF